MTTLIGLYWLPIQYRGLYKVLLVTLTSLRGKGPEYLNNLLIPACSLRSAAGNKLCSSSCHYFETQRTAFSIRSPTEWNKQRAELCNKNNVKSFKTALKTYIFKKSYMHNLCILQLVHMLCHFRVSFVEVGILCIFILIHLMYLIMFYGVVSRFYYLPKHIRTCL